MKTEPPSILDTLKHLIDAAQKQLDDAYRILGSEPSGETDILIFPLQPISGQWMATGLTKVGRDFIRKFWLAQPFSSRQLAKLKLEAADWNLKYRTEYPVLSLEDAALEPKVDP